MDNDYATWTNYRNQYWPAEYLIDANGTVRHIKFGEGDYDVTEHLIRQLLSQIDTNASLPPGVDTPDTTPTSQLTPETYLGSRKAVNYGGQGTYQQGTDTFDYPARLPDSAFALRGRWTLDNQAATAEDGTDTIELNYHAHNVYLVVGGVGTLTVTESGQTKRIPVGGPPNMHQVVSNNTGQSGHVEVELSRGLQAYSFTYG
jgi:hypothetical protein